MEMQKAVIKNMDHLGLVAGMIDELMIVESINDALPSNQSKKLSYGESVKAMILKINQNMASVIEEFVEWVVP